MSYRFILLLTVLSLSAQAKIVVPPGETTVIKGRCHTGVSCISLCHIIDGHMHKIATDTIAKDQSFDFSFHSTDTMMYILDDGFHTYRLYLKPDEQVEVRIQDSRLFLEGTNTRANKILNTWDSITSHIREGIWSFVDGQMKPEVFCFEMQNLNTYIQTRLPQSPNQRFNKFMKQTALADRDYLALVYLTGPGGSKLKITGFPQLYNEILQPGEPEKNNYLAQSYGKELLELYCRYYYNNSSYTLEDVLPLFSSVLYKGEIVLLFLNRFSSPDDCRDLLRKYGRYITSDDQQNRVDAILQKLAPYSRGNKAFDFSFEDRKNNKVSLSDFKGKLVLVDVWATTCRPCVAEIPFLKKVEEYFRVKEIVFIGISTDRLKDRELWEKFVTEHKLPGIQLFAGGFENSLVKDYQISSIPRFMLFDREGKIITVDAPLPSDPELVRLIEQYF